jgi:hypothetical protein
MDHVVALRVFRLPRPWRSGWVPLPAETATARTMKVLSQFAVTNGADNQPHSRNAECGGTHAQKHCAQPCQLVVHPGPPSGCRLFDCQTQSAAQAAAKVTSPPAAVFGAVSNLPLIPILIDCCTDMRTNLRSGPQRDERGNKVASTSNEKRFNAVFSQVRKLGFQVVYLRVRLK